MQDEWRTAATLQAWLTRRLRNARQQRAQFQADRGAASLEKGRHHCIEAADAGLVMFFQASLRASSCQGFLPCLKSWLQ